MRWTEVYDSDEDDEVQRLQDEVEALRAKVEAVRRIQNRLALYLKCADVSPRPQGLEVVYDDLCEALDDPEPES